MNNQNNEQITKRDLKKLFNMNNILTHILNFAAYIILVMSLIALLYLSFVERFNIEIDWLTLGIFSLATVFLSYLNWNTFYKRQYEKLMAEDIAEHSINKYSIHARYYNAIKDWSDIELQKKIDEFNEEYTAKWLRWVEKYTGVPIETRDEVQLDANGNPKLDENGKPVIVTVKGIKDLPYKGFKHKILMWRIKHHVYPQSGYKTSMELMSLFSFQDSNLNKRNLKADRQYFSVRSISKFIQLMLMVLVAASVVPEMISGAVGSAILKLLIAIISVVTSVLTGAMNGIKGARLKLSVVEDACMDLERWADKKTVLAPYKDFEKVIEPEQAEESKPDEVQQPVTEEIFHKLKLPK